MLSETESKEKGWLKKDLAAAKKEIELWPPSIRKYLRHEKKKDAALKGASHEQR